MIETKGQKQYIIIAIVVVVILGLISACSKPQFHYFDTTNNSNPNQKVADAQAYINYLNTLKVDPAASKQLFEEIITKDELTKEVSDALEVNQPIVNPVIPVSSFTVVAKSGQQAISDYLTNTVGPTEAFSKSTKDLTPDLFVPGTRVAASILTQEQQLMGKLSTVPVPKEAVSMHQALLASFASYEQLLKTSAAYSNGANDNPWPDVYQQYAVINNATRTYTDDLHALDVKYKLASLPPLHYTEVAETAHNPFIPSAQAFLGVGDVTITVGDIPSLIMDAVKQGLVTAFSQFMGKFIENVLAKIESNYAIANFLYYSDALVSGQYTDDYLNKYVSNTIDREIVKKFIPQLSCNKQNADLKPFFQAKAMTSLGFDPSTININDPNYYAKLSSVGNFLSSPTGWEISYQDLAAETESAAEKAADKELTSPGLKTPRDTIKNTISSSVNDIVSAEHASFNAIFQLGINNADKIVSQFVAQLTTQLVNNFVFKGVVSSGGSVGVLKEQSTCLAAAQIQLVLPASVPAYQTPPPPPNKDDLLNQSCASLPRGCS